MATLNQNQIEDFSELGQSFSFKYNDKIYSIPPIPPVTARKLLKNAREFSIRSSEREKKLKLFEEENSLLPEDQKRSIPVDLMDESENFFDFQVSFILTSGIVEIKQDGTESIEITNNDIENNWSTQLVMRIFRKINEIISVEQEKKS